jgi:hypothetical protein
LSENEKLSELKSTLAGFEENQYGSLSRLSCFAVRFFPSFLLIIFVLVGGLLSLVTINDSSPDTIPRQSRLKNF